MIDCYGDETVKGGFIRVVFVDTEVNIGKPGIALTVYTSSEPNPVFVTDAKCNKVGTVVLGYEKG
ncbi:hypothetical protein MAR_025993 [Mya arenaria]|uniref:Uncharacterized protein n=1 Tax=Mya arenaria TaxID=6604 RepID=A0ABY7ETD0_MYAAR|nr:hypothetical protein MAR_025993 [Mya arenaria]